MANVRTGNSHYVDATGTLESDGVKVAYILVTATSANAVVAITAADGTTNKLNLRVATSGETALFDFSTIPIYFPGGVRVTTLTNAIATVVYT